MSVKVSFKQWWKAPANERDEFHSYTLHLPKPRPCTRPWKDQAIFDTPAFDKITTFSDIHGDFGLLVANLFTLAQVASFDSRHDRITWTGGKAAVVIVGDLVDRGRGVSATRASPGEFINEEEAIFDLLNLLDGLAAPFGGRIFKLLGNHELTQSAPDHYQHYLTPVSRLKYPSPVARRDSFRRGPMFRRMTFCGNFSIVRIYNLIFVHGGLSPESFAVADRVFPVLSRSTAHARMAPLSKLIQTLNAAGSLALRWGDDPKFVQTFGKLVLDPKASPFWNRELSASSSPEACRHYAQVVQAMELFHDPFFAKTKLAPQLVLGHTIQLPERKRKEEERGNNGKQEKVEKEGKQAKGQKAHTAQHGHPTFDIANYFSTVIHETKSMVVLGHPCRRTVSDIQNQNLPELPPHGMRVLCCGADAPKLFLMDYAGSRAFDSFFGMESRLRRPQVLEFYWDKRPEQYIPILKISKHGLYRHGHHTKDEGYWWK